MASFKTHVVVAGAIGCGLSYWFMKSGITHLKDSIELTLLVLVGGILPDIDAGNSRINRYVFLLLGIAAIIYYFNIIGWGFSAQSIQSIAIILIGMFIAKIIFNLFTTHRGIYHSIPVGIVAACITALSLRYYSTLNGKYTAGAMLLGFLVHLLLDELYSIDFARMKLKKSFGSAFKFRSNEVLPTVIAYIATLGSATLFVWQVL